MKRLFKIKEVQPDIFLFEFKNNYDMCMHFLRYQEFYESSSAKFRGKKFTIFNFMRWYSNAFGNGAFTYTTDWIGFNIPGDTIKTIHQLGIDDKNFYDREMLLAWKECKSRAKGKFYIIGAVQGNIQTLNHEIAHGLFYLNSKYKKEMTALVKELNPLTKVTMKTVLKNIGYASKVYIDEMQAYMSTGLGGTFGHVDWKKEEAAFITVFKKYKG